MNALWKPLKYISVFGCNAGGGAENPERPERPHVLFYRSDTDPHSWQLETIFLCFVIIIIISVTGVVIMHTTVLLSYYVDTVCY